MAFAAINWLSTLKLELDHNLLKLFVLEDFLSVAVPILGANHGLIVAMRQFIHAIHMRNYAIIDILEIVDTGLV